MSLNNKNNPHLPKYGDTVAISRNHGSHARGMQGVVWGYDRNGRARVRISAGWFARVLPGNLTVIKSKNGK